jgi:hypothetical protein
MSDALEGVGTIGAEDIPESPKGSPNGSPKGSPDNKTDGTDRVPATKRESITKKGLRGRRSVTEVRQMIFM